MIVEICIICVDCVDFVGIKVQMNVFEVDVFVFLQCCYCFVVLKCDWCFGGCDNVDYVFMYW